MLDSIAGRWLPSWFTPTKILLLYLDWDPLPGTCTPPVTVTEKVSGGVTMTLSDVPADHVIGELSAASVPEAVAEKSTVDGFVSASEVQVHS